MSDSVPNYKHSLQKLKTQVLIPNSLEALQFSGFIVPFSVFQCKSNQIQLFPESETQVERKYKILRNSNFCFPLHTFPFMESNGSMHFHVWNHMIPCVELHGRSVGHGSMHGIVWNHTDHMLPCMESH